MVFVIANYNSWKQGNGIIDNDILEYYGYLPASMIYHDVSMKFSIGYGGTHTFYIWTKNAPNGAMVFKMTMGMTYMYAPFFFAGHWYAQMAGYDAGGYTLPYQIAIMLSALFYFALGLIFLRKILQKFFNNFTTAITLLLIVFGTNLFYYASISGPMTHVYTFSLFCVMMYYTMKWHENQSFKNTLIIGLAIGLMIIIRPTNMLLFLFFILWDIKSIKDILPRFKLLLKRFPYLLIILFCVIIFWIPQIYYWKTITGQWLYYSYADEHFFFTKPHIISGFIGFRKGWFIYTPLMMFALAGFIIAYKKARSFFLPMVFIILLNSYVIFSWWCWWYGGSFGQRSMIDMYGLLAIGLALLLNFVWQQKLLLKIPAIVVILAITFLSIFNTLQYQYGSLSIDAMTRASYQKNFGHLKPYGNYYELLQCPDYKKAKMGIQDNITCK